MTEGPPTSGMLKRLKGSSELDWKRKTIRLPSGLNCGLITRSSLPRDELSEFTLPPVAWTVNSSPLERVGWSAMNATRSPFGFGRKESTLHPVRLAVRCVTGPPPTGTL